MKISARNQLEGTVKDVTEGAVNCEVVVELSGGQELVAIVTKASVDALGIAPGKTVFAVVKASNVMLGMEH